MLQMHTPTTYIHLPDLSPMHRRGVLHLDGEPQDPKEEGHAVFFDLGGGRYCSSRQAWDQRGERGYIVAVQLAIPNNQGKAMYVVRRSQGYLEHLIGPELSAHYAEAAQRMREHAAALKEKLASTLAEDDSIELVCLPYVNHRNLPLGSLNLAEEFVPW